MVDLNDDLTCAVCSEIYEETLCEPILLPKCGHSFCRPCLVSVEGKDSTFLCPTCRTPHIGPPVDQIPVNYALLSISRKVEIQVKKVEIFKITKNITFKIKEEKEILSQRLNAIATECMVMYKKSKILNGFISEVEETEKNTTKSQVLGTLKKILTDIKIINNKVSEVTKDVSQSPTKLEIGKGDQTNRGSSCERESLVLVSQQLSRVAEILVKKSLNTGKADTSWKLHRTVPGCTNIWPKVPWNDFMKQLPSVQMLIPIDSPEVFFDLTAGETSLGRITIRLWAYMMRAQQFLALCLGTLGPTYKGSSFERVQVGLDSEQEGVEINSGKSSDHVTEGNEDEKEEAVIRPDNRILMGGYYNIDGGTKSAQGLMDDLEWGGKFRQASRKGLVAGWSYQRPELEATYGILFGNSPTGYLISPFGEISSGMDVLEAISLRVPITDVMIADCGLVTQ